VPGNTDTTKAIARSPELVRAERDIALARERVSQSVLALRDAVAKQTDWREWVRSNPSLFMAAAFTLGLLWGSRSRRRSAPDAGETITNRGGTWTWK
jgi:hypothetical protein